MVLMKRWMKGLVMCSMFWGLSACAPTSPTSPKEPAQQGEAAQPAAAASPMSGADRDAHGCIGSAGEVWSGVRGACVRLFEVGLAFEPDPAPEQGAVLLAYVVVAPEQGEVRAAELFVPGRAAPIALRVVHTPEGDIRPTVLDNAREGVTVFRYRDDHVLELPGQRYRRISGGDDRLFDIR